MEQEPEWDDEQVALLIAAQEQRADIGPHGVPMSDATSPLADPNDRFHGWTYTPRVRVDHAAKVLNAAKADRAHKYPDEDADALIWALERVDAVAPPHRKQ